MDPHGAVAYLGLLDFMKNFPKSEGIFFETAHPAKFSSEVEKAIGRSVPMPKRLKTYVRRKKQAVLLKNNFSKLKDFLLNKLQNKHKKYINKKLAKNT